MEKADRIALISLIVIILVGLGLAWAGSQGGTVVSGVPLFAGLLGLAFVVQWVVFIPAYLAQSERFFDLTGSFTYIAVIVLAVVLSPVKDNRSLLMAALVAIWAVRLGSFLFRRIHKAGKDGRFDSLKPYFLRFLNTWTLQGLWVSFTLAAALAAVTTSARKELDIFALVGLLIWLFGFIIEVVADAQKNRFRANPENAGRYIHTGLWSWSRHPNYFGEIVLWIGMAIIALPVLSDWQWVTLISPVFVTLLLTRISGVPMLERRADRTWGGQEDYEAYKARTSVLIPRPPK
jgi:steroid 5-alpha reductase family enzyme